MHVLTWLLLGLVGIICQYGNAADLEREKITKNWHEEIVKIDQIIDILTELRNKELAKATWEQNQGDHFQFQPQNSIDAHHCWNCAEINRKIAENYQHEIDKFVLRKRELLKNNIDHTPLEN